MLGRPFPSGVRLERQRARDHFVSHHAERVDVAPAIELRPGKLLGAHVRGGSEYRTRLRQFLFARLISGVAALGDPEVEHLHKIDLAGPLGEHHVLRLQIAVDDALLVCLVQRTANLLHDVIDPWSRHTPVVDDHIGKRLSVDELHRDVKITAGGLPEIIKRDRVRVLEAYDGAALAVETPLNLDVLRKFREERLYRNPPDGGAHLLLGDVDASHAAFAEKAHDSVPPFEHGPNQRVIRWALVERHEYAALGTEARPLDVGVVTRRAIHGTVYPRTKFGTLRNGAGGESQRPAPNASDGTLLRDLTPAPPSDRSATPTVGNRSTSSGVRLSPTCGTIPTMPLLA